jgi:hypothetical protein
VMYIQLHQSLLSKKQMNLFSPHIFLQYFQNCQ